jgi:non-heme chloroperoxidase
MRRAFAFLCLSILCLVASPLRAADVKSRFFVTSDGVRLHYLEAGTGRTIVLVPGWSMPAWIWQPQIDDFAHSFHVVALDPRSQGESEITWSGDEPYRRGQDIAELIARSSAEPVLLVGWSLGVLDALAYVHSDGDRSLAGLVLVDNSVGEDPPPLRPHRQVRPRPLPREMQMALFVRGMFRRPQAADYLDRLTETALRTPRDIAAELLAYPLPRTYWRDAIYSTSKPILYVVRPHLLGQAANLQARHPGVETALFADAGHALFIDDAERFDALVRAFIRHRIWP